MPQIIKVLFDLNDPPSLLDYAVMFIVFVAVFVVLPVSVYELSTNPISLPHVVGGTGDHSAK